MARRRIVDLPDEADLERIDKETADGGFAAKPARAPIAQIAAEAAALSPALSPDDEAARNRDRADAQALRDARAAGWEVRAIPVAEVHVDAASRDRIAMEAEAMDELRASIRAHGLRTPIEVSPRNHGEGYDLISGLRRLTATADVMGPGATIRAFVRPLRGPADTFVAMVEENEIRANLTVYERGRAAVIAVQDGAFATIGEAVDSLFGSSSKTKRSKVRSFAIVHEELGDLLQHPRALNERQCLQLSAGIKAGAGPQLRDALESGEGRGPREEWAALAAALPTTRDTRPTAGGFRSETADEKPAVRRDGTVDLGEGRSARAVVDGLGRHSILLEGPVDPLFVSELMERLRR